MRTPGLDAGRLSGIVVAAGCLRSWRESLRVGQRGRVVAYVLVLTVLTSVFSFYRLSEGTLFGDEAAFACTTDRMRATGDWVVPRITDAPHLNAAPLYNWLTLALAPWSDGGPLWYRVWSAAFGVGCVLMGFALGAFLFRAEVGLLAGLFLCLNHTLLFDHGIRFGGMDAMTTFFVTAAVLCYAWVLTGPVRARAGWGLLGAFIGLACLSKPPVFGGFFFTLISAHWFLSQRGVPVRGRVAGPLVAAAAAVLVAGPWYALIWFRLGTPGLHTLFVFNSVTRAVDPADRRNLLCCHDALWFSSRAFRLTELALACALVCCVAKHQRRPLGMLSFLAAGYILALTAAGKAGNYLLYAFPLVAVLVAGLLLEFGPHLVARFRPRYGRTAARIGAVAAVVVVGIDARTILRDFARPAWVHPPVGVYERVTPELAEGRCRFVLYDFPSPSGATASGRALANYEDLYYPPRMPLADRVGNLDELSRLLRDGRPTIVVLPPVTTGPVPCEGLNPDVRIENNPYRFQTYPVLTFHGATAIVPAVELSRLVRANQR